MEKELHISKEKLSRELLISFFMEKVLTEGLPTSVFSFCKSINITEAEFYNFFGSLEILQKSIWIDFHDHVLNILSNNKEYEEYSNREKLLSFYFTFFEMLTVNRSYVLWSLNFGNNKIENLKQLSSLRKKIVSFGKGLVEDSNENKQLKIIKKPVALVSEAVWFQFLFLLKFWKEDDSVNFEKTDIAIEKSVNTVFDVFDNTPLESIIDFGKFLWKEKMS